MALPPGAPGFWWRVLSPVGAVVVSFVLLVPIVIVAGAVLGRHRDTEVGAIAVFLGSLAILLLGATLLYRQPRHERAVTMGLKHTGRGAVLMGLNVGAGLTLTAMLIMAAGTVVQPGLGDRLKDQEIELGTGVWPTVVIVIALVVLAPLGEELTFRGLLLRGLIRRMRFWPAAVVSGTVFALLHADWWPGFLWPRLLGLIAVGIGLAWLYRWRGYWASVTAHATVNTVAAIALIASR